MTASVPHEVDLWRLIDAEGGYEQPSASHVCTHNEAVRDCLKHVEALGYSEGTPVPTAAHYAALKEAADWALAEIEGRTRYSPDIYDAEAQRNVSLGRLRAALEPSK